MSIKTETQSMSTQHSDKLFTDSIPQVYDKYLVPLIFEDYAQDLARRVKEKPTNKVLEVAAGTGVATRALADVLDPTVPIVATDLNQDMLDYGASVRFDENIEWLKADVFALPFEDNSFDAILCQFGVMFFPDRIKACSEILRVLKPGGRFIFNVWDKIEDNQFADTVTASLENIFPDDPPQFLPRTPHGYFDKSKIATELVQAGFTSTTTFETLEFRSRAESPIIPAIAYCQGTPLRNEIEKRDGSQLKYATDVAAKALSKRFGSGAIDGKIQGHVITTKA